MIYLPKNHYKIFGLRLGPVQIKLDYWHRQFKRNIILSGVKIYDRSFYDLQGKGYFNKSLFIGLFVLQIELCFQIPWISKKHNLKI